MKRLIVLFFAVLACCGQGVAFAIDQDARARAQAHTELGSAYFSRGQFSVALEELKEALKADSRYAQAYNVLGLVNMELREYAQAEENFRSALGYEESNPEIHNNFGWFLCQRNRVDEAMKHFDTALKNPLYATPAKSHINVGLCSLKKNNLEAAEDAFVRALKLQPQSPQALYYLGEMAYMRKDYLEAKEYCSRLLQVAPSAPDVLWLAVRIERALGNKQAEDRYGTQLRKSFPDSRETLALRNNQYDFSELSKFIGQRNNK
ncbi:MAG: type IV pilus biogenesis/stability protein PilW [Sulfuricella sp.]|nr:type IV pilus biogenesis/stability protein PilW [Sulfuricella sp.]